MKTIDGEEYWEISDLAEFWGMARNRVSEIMYQSKKYPKGHPFRRPEPDKSMRGMYPLWKKSRLGELNTWFRSTRRTNGRPQR